MKLLTDASQYCLTRMFKVLTTIIICENFFALIIQHLIIVNINEIKHIKRFKLTLRKKNIPHTLPLYLLNILFNMKIGAQDSDIVRTAI